MSTTTEPSELRIKAGQCPACLAYLWAQVSVVTDVGEPRVDNAGLYHPSAHARPVSGVVEHRCRYDEDDEAWERA